MKERIAVDEGTVKRQGKAGKVQKENTGSEVRGKERDTPER